MRVSSNDNDSMLSSNKRGVTFDAMETLERNSNCIEKLMFTSKCHENDYRQETVSPIN